SFITYTNDFGGRGTFIARQLSGGSAIAGKTVTDRSQACPPNLACPPLVLAGPASGEVAARETPHLEFVATNNGVSAGTFRYELADGLGWTRSWSAPLSGVTPAIAAGQSFTLAVDAQVPNDCPAEPQVYRWKVSGTGAGCAAESSSVQLQCTGALAVGEDAIGFGL